VKIAILVMALVFNSANLQQSFAFVDCGYGTLYYSEEVSEDEPVSGNEQEEGVNDIETLGETISANFSV
jgi:hypothetical protein